MKKGLLNVIIDGQWGSTGKGKLAGCLALKHDVAVAVCDFQTNAGHTFVYDDGKSVVNHQLPSSAINKDTLLLINAGASITPDVLLKEIEEFEATERLIIHPNAVIITEDCRIYERKNLNRISSTLKGCGAAQGMKAMRHPAVILAKDEPRLAFWIGDTSSALRSMLKRGAYCLAEGAQGFDLSLNHGHLYPYVTSRDITTCAILSNAGVPPQMVGSVYGSIRAFPIRVGHAYNKETGEKIGDSGPFYSDQEEISWEELHKRSDTPLFEHPLLERTTVTQKIRRVFTFSFEQLKRFIQACGVTDIFLNFVNHLSFEDYEKRLWSELSPYTHAFVKHINGFLEELYESDFPGHNPPMIRYLGTGSKNSDIVEMPE